MPGPMSWFKHPHSWRTDRRLETLSDAEYRCFLNLYALSSEQADRGTIYGFEDDLLALEVCRGDVDLLAQTLDRLHRLRIASVGVARGLPEDPAADVATRHVTFLEFERDQRVKPSDTPERRRERQAASRAAKAAREAAEAGAGAVVTPAAAPPVEDTAPPPPVRHAPYQIGHAPVTPQGALPGVSHAPVTPRHAQRREEENREDKKPPQATPAGRDADAPGSSTARSRSTGAARHARCDARRARRVRLRRGSRSRTSRAARGPRSRRSTGAGRTASGWCSPRSACASASARAPDTGCTLCDLDECLKVFVAAFRRMPPGVIGPLFADCAGDRELRAAFMTTLFDPPRAAVKETLDRAHARGDLRDDVDRDLILDLIGSLVHYRTLFGHAPHDRRRDRARGRGAPAGHRHRLPAAARAQPPHERRSRAAPPARLTTRRGPAASGAASRAGTAAARGPRRGPQVQRDEHGGRDARGDDEHGGAEAVGGGDAQRLAREPVGAGVGHQDEQRRGRPRRRPGARRGHAGGDALLAVGDARRRGDEHRREDDAVADAEQRPAPGPARRTSRRATSRGRAPARRARRPRARRPAWAGARTASPAGRRAPSRRRRTAVGSRNADAGLQRVVAVHVLEVER